MVLSTAGVDTTTLRVRIQTAPLNAALKHFYSVRKHPHPKGRFKVYFLEERTDGFYQVTFGDGVLGKNLDTDNVVLVDYIVSNGVAGNGARSFRSPTNFTGNAETVTGTTVSRFRWWARQRDHR